MAECEQLSVYVCMSPLLAGGPLTARSGSGHAAVITILWLPISSSMLNLKI